MTEREPDGGDATVTEVLLGGFSAEVADGLARRLPGARVRTAATGAELLAGVESALPTVVVLDHALAAPPAAQVLARLHAGHPSLPVLYALPPASGADLAHRLVDELGVRRLIRHACDADVLAREVGAVVPPPAAPASSAAPTPPPAVPSAGSPAPPVAGSVAALWEKFRGVTLARVTAVEDAALAALEGPLDAEARRAAEREAHKLAGSAGTFGFAEASRVARQAEHLLEGERPLEPAQVLRLSELAVALRRELERPVPAAAPQAEPPASAAGGAERPLLLVAGAGSGDDFAARVAEAAEARGLAVRTGEPAPGERARAVLVELDGTGGRERLAEATARFPDAATVVVSDTGGFAERLAAARLGARVFLRRPVSPARAVEAVQGLLERGDLAGRQVLVVDDDPAALAVVRARLEPAGIAVTTVSDPRSFWETLERLRPDLLVLDVDVPKVGGLDLCRVVRGDPRWSGVPVVFLTGRTDAATVEQLFAAGADDYVPKPIVGAELVRRIENRLERIRLQRKQADADPLTGVSVRGRALAASGRLLRLAARHRQPVAAARVEVDGLAAINERAGHAAGDELLRRMGRLLGRACREDDVVGRLGGRDFLFTLYGTDREDGAQRVAEVLERFAAERVAAPSGPVGATATAGVAEAPADGADLRALLGAADAALLRAREAGGGRVLPAGWVPGAADRSDLVDVVVVEDDEALASLLRHALETRGLRTHWLGDGQAAADALTGPRPALRARVVLLDVDLPGRDGVGVLRDLAAAGVLARTRVLMLTARAAEGEVLRALEAGAFDHVSKPFSLPVLLQRIRRALGSD